MVVIVMQLFRKSCEWSSQVHVTICDKYLCCIYLYMVFLSAKVALCVSSLMFCMFCVTVLKLD